MTTGKASGPGPQASARRGLTPSARLGLPVLALLIAGGIPVVHAQQAAPRVTVDGHVASVADAARLIADRFVDEIGQQRLWDAAVDGMMKAAVARGIAVSSDALEDFRKLQAARSDKDRRSALKKVLTRLEKSGASQEPGAGEFVRWAVHGMAALTDSYGSVMTLPAQRIAHPGVELRIQNGAAVVLSTIENGPADRAGICPGDAIVRVGDRAVAGLSRDEILQLLRGPSNTSIDIALSRAGRDAAIVLQVAREELSDAGGIARASMIAAGTAYVRLQRFDDQTDRDLKRALRNLSSEGMQGLVLDLRDNPGGPLAPSITVAGLFLRKGDPVVSLRGNRVRIPDSIYKATDTEFAELPLVLLVNGGTVAAPEIVAGALQDHGRATIVGTQTAGSGTIQAAHRLTNGMWLMLTTARWLTPKDRAFLPGDGLRPDITVSDPSCEERGNPGRTDHQLQAALDVMAGLVRGKSESVPARRVDMTRPAGPQGRTRPTTMYRGLSPGVFWGLPFD